MEDLVCAAWRQEGGFNFKEFVIFNMKECQVVLYVWREQGSKAPAMVSNWNLVTSRNDHVLQCRCKVSLINPRYSRLGSLEERTNII